MSSVRNIVSKAPINLQNIPRTRREDAQVSMYSQADTVCLHAGVHVGVRRHKGEDEHEGKGPSLLPCKVGGWERG